MAMPGIELSTTFSIPIRYIALNTSQNSICKKPQQFVAVTTFPFESLKLSRMYNGLRSTLDFNIKLRALEKTFASQFAFLAKNLAISLLKFSDCKGPSADFLFQQR